MSYATSKLRRWLDVFRCTPLHPQWLLGSNHRVSTWIAARADGLVLDIGCADRWASQHLSPTCSYIGLDYPVTGKVKYSARPNVFADAARLPFPDKSMDTVLLLEVLEHLQYPSQALAEIARVLKPGGRLLLTMPFLYPIHDAPHDYQRYTAHGLTRELDAAGFANASPSPNLGSCETAGLMATLALGGMMVRAISERRLSMVLLPIVRFIIPSVNLLAWLLARILPSWPALTAGYRVEVTRS